MKLCTQIASVVALTLALIGSATASAQSPVCGKAPVQVQILNSGGPELDSGQAASSILIWIDGKPRVLVDAGPGSVQRFADAGASLNDIDVILLTHLRVERTGDLPALLQLASPTPRNRALPIYGPAGNQFMPSTVTFMRALFDPMRGAWRYLGGFLSPLNRGSYKLEPRDLRSLNSTLRVPRENREDILSVFGDNTLRIAAISLTSGQTPTMAWRIETQGKRIIIAGTTDVNATNTLFERLAHGADLLIVPHTTMEDTEAGTRVREMGPVAAAAAARSTDAKHLVLSPRGHATLAHAEQTTTTIRRHYSGTLTLGDNMECLTP